MRRALEGRSLRDAVRLLRDLHARALAFSEGLPPPRPPLGVPHDARTLSLMQHAFAVERPDRFSAVLELCRDDPRRRFVLGRDRYDGEVKTRVDAMLAELEHAEQSHADGTIERAFLDAQAEAKLSARDVLGGDEAQALMPPHAEARCDGVVDALQCLGYARDDIGDVLRALLTHEMADVQALFTLFDAEGEGELGRSEVARSLLPVARALGGQGADSHLRRELESALGATGGGHRMAVHEFTALIRRFDLTRGVAPDAASEHESMDGSKRGSSFNSKRGSFGSFRRREGGSFKRRGDEDAAASSRAERALMRHVPRRMRRSCETLRDNMLEAGYTPADTRVVRRAMFVTQEQSALLPAWKVFDPMGRGVLSLAEVQAAFALFGDAVPLVDVTTEFQRLDADASGSIEINEFGALLRRLAALARGAPPVGEVGQGLLGAASFELELLKLLEPPLHRNVPLSMHPFVRRLFGTLSGLGFAPDQVEVLLRAIFHPEPAEADEAARQAWLLLGGTDWALAGPAEPDELQDVRSEYEARRQGGKRWRELERARQAIEEQQPAVLPERSADAEVEPERRSGWSKLRNQRKGVLVATALRSAAMDVKKRLRQQPAMLRYGCMPRRGLEFDEWGSIGLSDFERLVSVFGDWQSDFELRRCQPMLAELFAPLDQETGSAEEDDASFASYSGSFKYSAISKPVADGARRSSLAVTRGSLAAVGKQAGADDTVDGKVFLDVIRKLRPLGKDEKDGDAELMALAEEFASGGDPSVTWAIRERMPDWMAAMAQRVAGPGALGVDGREKDADKASGSGAAGGEDEGATGALDALDALQRSVARGRVDVLGVLEDSTKAMVPIEHLSTLRLVLSNLRVAEFDAAASNILVRALYSFNDDEYGAAYREDAWQLLRTNQMYLHLAADSLAREVGEFRSEEHRFQLPGLEALRHTRESQTVGGAVGGTAAAKERAARQQAQERAAQEDGLLEEELQLLVFLLGEHLSAEQLRAVFTFAEDHFNDAHRVPFDKMDRILRFMYPRLRTSLGSIKDNEDHARELEAEENGMGGVGSLAAAGRAIGSSVVTFARDLVMRFS